jgi:hypothetical protein
MGCSNHFWNIFVEQLLMKFNVTKFNKSLSTSTISNCSFGSEYIFFIENNKMVKYVVKLDTNIIELFCNPENYIISEELCEKVRRRMIKQELLT